MTASSWPIEIRALEPAACGAVLWRYRGQARLTVVVNGVFAMSPERAMSPVAAAGAGDLAPYRARADFVITGSVYAPAGGAQALNVRVGLVGPGGAAVDKALQVIGDRVRTPTSLAEHPFVQMPLIGFGPIPRSWPARARLLGSLDPRALERTPLEIPDDFDWAYFQAAPPDQQCEYLRGDEWILLENVYAAHPLMRTRLPGAKAIGELRGLPGEERGHPLTLHADSLHVDTERGLCSVTWRASLPLADGVSPAGLELVAGVEVEGRPLALPVTKAGTRPPPPAAPSAPMPSFDGTMALDADDIIELVEVAHAPQVEQPIDLEATAQFAGRAPAPPEPVPSPGINLLLSAPAEGTADLSSLLAHGPALPFTAPGHEGALPPTMTKPPSPPARPAARKDPFDATLEISGPSQVRPALPFPVPMGGEPPHPTPQPGPTIEAAPKAFDETITVIEGSVPSLAAPFAVAQPSDTPASPVAPIPGAPWSPPELAPQPAFPQGDVTAVLHTSIQAEAPRDHDGGSPPTSPASADLETPVSAESTPSPPQEPPKPPPQPAPVEPPAATEKPTWSWAAPDPAEAENLRAAAAPKPIPAPEVAGTLYLGFSKKKK